MAVAGALLLGLDIWAVLIIIVKQAVSKGVENE